MARFITHHHKNRTTDYTITLLQADGTAFNIAASDRCLVKIGRNSATPDLDLDSAAATDNGSSVTVTSGSNVVTLRIAEGDTTSLEPGAYDCEISVVDASETAGQRTKHAQDGTFFLHPTPA